MAKNITVKYDEQMMQYQLDIISNHYCKSIIPASVAHVDGEYIVTYHMEGFRPVKANMATLQLMKLLLKVNELLEDLQDHLFFQGDYVLSLETLFYNPRLDEYQITIIQRTEEQEGDAFLSLISQLEGACMEESKTYLNDVRSFLEEFNPDRNQLMKYIDRKSQEIYQCGVD